MQDDPLADGALALLGVVGQQVIVSRVDIVVPKDWPGNLGDGILQRDQRGARAARNRGLVARCQRRGLACAVALVEFSLGGHSVTSSISA